MDIKNKKLPEIVLIVAMTESGLIGKGNEMPWKSSLDFEWFKHHTIGWPMIFGRNTAAGMPQFPLKNRPCAIVTNQSDTEVVPATRDQGAYLSFGPGPFYDSLKEALRFYKNFDKIFIAGGATLYKQALQQNKPWVELFGSAAAKQPMVDTIIKTVFPDGYCTGDKYLDKQTMDSMGDPYFKILHEENYTLQGYHDDKLFYDSIDGLVAKNAYDKKLTFRNPIKLLHDLKPSDTRFPNIKFQILNRVKENPGL